MRQMGFDNLHCSTYLSYVDVVSNFLFPVLCRLFELFTSILDVLVHNARIEGRFDSGIVDMKANSVELLTTPKVDIA